MSLSKFNGNASGPRVKYAFTSGDAEGAEADVIVICGPDGNPVTPPRPPENLILTGEANVVDTVLIELDTAGYNNLCLDIINVGTGGVIHHEIANDPAGPWRAHPDLTSSNAHGVMINLALKAARYRARLSTISSGTTPKVVGCPKQI